MAGWVEVVFPYVCSKALGQVFNSPGVTHSLTPGRQALSPLGDRASDPWAIKLMMGA